MRPFMVRSLGGGITPPAQVSVYLIGVAQTEAQIGWNASIGADSYNVYQNGQLVDNTPATYYATTRQLVPGQTYTFAVSPLAGTLEGSQSPLIQVTTVVVPLDFYTTSPLPSATQGIAYTEQFNATGGVFPGYVWTLATPVTGVTLSTGGLLSIPLPVGTYTFQITVTDAVGTAVSGTFTMQTIPVGAVPAAPVISLIQQSSTVSGVALVTIPTFPANNGSPITDLVVTASTGQTGMSATAGVIQVPGVPLGVPVTFTAIAVNANGNSLPSATTGAITLIWAPTVPQNIVATAGVNSVIVSAAAPASTGGTPITGATASVVGQTGTQTLFTAPPWTFTLPAVAGTTTTANVHAFNAYKVGPDGASNSFTPTAATGPSKANLLNYVAGISGKTLVGQHVQLFNGNGTATALTQWNALISATGKTPAIMGTLLNTTYIMGLGTVGIDGPTNAALFQQQTNNGGLIHLSWYMPNPVTNASNSSSGNASLSASDFTKCITPGNSVYNNFQSYLASAVATLQSAPYAGIPCFFRPFIEFSNTASGQNGYNWYSNENSADFITFWQMTYNYFVNAGVNWLVWVWNLNDYPPVTGGQYYPGDSYVDVVSSDTYPNPGNSSQIISDIGFNWATLQSINKPKMFSEVGYNGAGSGAGTNDNLVWLNTISSNFAAAFGYVVWDAQYAIVNGANASSMMSDPRSITLDKLPAGLV